MFKSWCDRVKKRIILHCDLNNFFASVSLLFNPTLSTFPVAVSGDKENRHGIILAKNEIAKKFGVKTAEPIFEAKNKCPDLVLLPPLRDKYKEYSQKAQRIYQRYTDMIEPFGIDECWLDVTGSTVIFGSGEEIAQKIRKDIKKELGITISVGVSFNKVFAKLGSDMKKPDAVTVITEENFKEKIWNLPASDLLFVGKSTNSKLKSNGINTIGDIARCNKETLEHLLGKSGIELWRNARGENNEPVSVYTDIQKPKSIGRSITCGNDFTNNEQVWKTFLAFAQEISDSLHKHNLYAGGIQVHIRNTSLSVNEFSTSFGDLINSSLTIAKRGYDLFLKNYTFGEPLRSVGLRAINLKSSNENAIQQDIFGDIDKDLENEKIEDSIYELRKKFGNSSIKRGSTIKKES